MTTMVMVMEIEFVYLALASCCCSRDAAETPVRESCKAHSNSPIAMNWNKLPDSLLHMIGTSDREKGMKNQLETD
jgi:hypothetical protein